MAAADRRSSSQVERHRFRRERAPLWMELGDWLALALMAALMAGGILSRGYVAEGWERAWAWAGCALLGLWSAGALAAGRWEGPGMRPARG